MFFRLAMPAHGLNTRKSASEFFEYRSSHDVRILSQQFGMGWQSLQLSWRYLCLSDTELHLADMDHRGSRSYARYASGICYCLGNWFLHVKKKQRDWIGPRIVWLGVKQSRHEHTLWQLILKLCLIALSQVCLVTWNLFAAFDIVSHYRRPIEIDGSNLE